jgi:hypothetical protein
MISRISKSFRSLTCLGVLAALPASSAFAQEAQWGSIKGRIIWGGDKVPPPAEIMLPAENEGAGACVLANKGKLPPDETWVIDQKNKGIKNTFIWLAAADKKPLAIHPDLKEIKIKQVEIDQPACHFIPHALALREGQTLLVKNSAPFPHNFKYDGEPNIPQNSGNIALPPGAEKKINLLAQRLPITVVCSTHGWMKCWIRVFDHPYYALTDENGAFEIKNAPAGKFRLMIWHENGWKGGAAGRDGDPVEIQPGPIVDLGNIAFPPPPKD